MDRFSISIHYKRKEICFEVADYLHHTETHCKFEAYLDGQFAASFEPDRHDHLHICKNAGIAADAVLYLLAEKLEALPHHVN